MIAIAVASAVAVATELPEPLAPASALAEASALASPPSLVAVAVADAFAAASCRERAGAQHSTQHTALRLVHMAKSMSSRLQRQQPGHISQLIKHLQVSMSDKVALLLYNST
jgi:hypothetical protein